MPGFLIPTIVILVIAFVLIMVHNVKQTKCALKDQNEIKETLPKILSGKARAENALRENNIVSTACASTMGHKFIDYKTVHNAPDNLNVVLDFTNKKIACYMLNPYEFHTYNFSDLRKYDFTVNNGKVDFSSSSLGVGTSLGGMGIGVATTQGSSQQQITAMALMLYFKDGTDFALNFTQNITCYKGDEFYLMCLNAAKSFCAKLDIILEENQSAVN